MELLKEKKDCSGCSACFNICPKNAIEMKEDEKGFKYPVIDQTKCINCGLCRNSCPVLKDLKQNNEIEAYACYNRNIEERFKSSSGGIFILIARKIIERKGVVFGACLDEEFKVKHSYAETIEELNKFMGSKYVQSTIGDMYKKAKEFLDNGRYVLFTGTPCQIEGLKSYLNKEYYKLYTQDIICHGVPSPLVWEKYKDYRENKDKKKPINISFRNKENGWYKYNMKFSYLTNHYKKSQSKDLFMKAFLKNTILRDSCYDCHFKKKNRNSDITLADYWGIQNVHKNLFDNKGTSLLVINSDKGKKIFEIIKEELIYEKTELDVAIKYNPSMIKSVNADPNREKFFENINNMEFDKLVDKYTIKFKKISIIKRILRKGKSIVNKIFNLKK